MFKYFFGCPAAQLVAKGKLIPEALGEAGTALRDCLLDKSQCMVSDIQASSELGAGTVIDPFPGDRSAPQAVFGLTRENHVGWKWIAFESGLFKPDGERVQALIGYDPTMVFTPAMLRRRRMVGGVDIPSGEQTWTIPVARSPAMAYGNLATRWAPSPGGKWERRLDKEDVALWELSGEVQDYLIWVRGPEEERPQWADPWSLDTTLQILGVNYRIGRPELLVLDSLDLNPITSMFSVNVLHALLGYSEWEAWMAELQKKTNPATNPAPADSSSGSGEQEESAGDLAVVS